MSREASTASRANIQGTEPISYKHLRTILLLGFVVLAGCNQGPSPGSVANTQAPSPIPLTATSPPATPPTVDLSNRPFVSFAPVPEQPAGKHLPLPDGSVDFYDLFEPDAAWTEAASHIDVFQLASWYVRHYATSAQLRQVIAGVNERGMALGLGMEPLEHPDPSECQQTESFEGKYDLEMAQRIKDFGGLVQVVYLDEPYAFAHKLDTPGSCQRPVEQVAAETADFVRRVRQIFPDVAVGSLEPLWSDPEINADDMANWLDAYQAAAGEPFAFLHMDVLWTRPDWPQVLREVEAVADERGVPFGVIYTGGPEAPSDLVWFDRAADRMTEYEEIWGGTPDHVDFESWEDYPKHALPESDVHTYSGWIDQYFAERTRMDWADSAQEAGGEAAFSGSLTTKGGKPIRGAGVITQVTPLSGAVQTLELDGTVPAQASEALIAIRVNIENAGPGDADLRLYNISLTTGDDGSNLVANASFASGMADWYPYGEGSASAPASDQGLGRMMLLTAHADQGLLIDSTHFAMTPGESYQLAVTTSVPEASANTALVALIFLNETEFHRDELLLNPAPITLGQVQTNDGGLFTLQLGDLDSGDYTIQFRYPGDLDHWPMHIEKRITIE